MLLATVAAGGSGSAEPVGPGGRSSHVKRILDRGKLVMTCFPTQASRFVSVNTARGPMKAVGTADDFQGLDVEILSAVAEDLGVALEVRPITQPSYREVLERLTSGTADVAASGLTITDQREQDVDFSIPYLRNVQVIIARKGAGPVDTESLRRSRIAAIEGSAVHELILQWGFSSDQIELVDFVLETYLAVAEGRTDIAVDDSVSLEADLAGHRALEPRFRLTEIQGFGFAVPEASDLKLRIDDVLQRMHREGSLEPLLARHLGVSADLSRLAYLPAVDDELLSAARLSGSR